MSRSTIKRLKNELHRFFPHTHTTSSASAIRNEILKCIMKSGDHQDSSAISRGIVEVSMLDWVRPGNTISR